MMDKKATTHSLSQYPFSRQTRYYIKDRGVDNKQIKVIAAVAAPPALQKLSEKFPGLHVYAGILDPTVNEKGFIIPGLGDAGDRSFGT
ncbi:uracil phosphoribosyltransferase [Salvia divinorum]|uniref:Uracil phosphoribosyltransferase n=1 Tax=Salvia divinorum TaxID=28513 RepID=A0ABD1GYX9_SALDI